MEPYDSTSDSSLGRWYLGNSVSFSQAADSAGRPAYDFCRKLGGRQLPRLVRKTRGGSSLSVEAARTAAATGDSSRHTEAGAATTIQALATATSMAVRASSDHCHWGLCGDFHDWSNSQRAARAMVAACRKANTTSRRAPA